MGDKIDAATAQTALDMVEVISGELTARGCVIVDGKVLVAFGELLKTTDLGLEAMAEIGLLGEGMEAIGLLGVGDREQVGERALISLKALTEANAALRAAQSGDDDELKTAQAALAAAQSDLAAAQDEIRMLKAEPSRTPAPARTRGKAKGEKRRACGPMERVDGATLGELLQSAAHEVVFSDGRSEIAGLEPVTAKPDAWLRHANGWLLAQPVLVDGPQRGAAPFIVAGFGLFDEEGEQVAYSALHEPVTVAPGSTTEFRRTIIF